MKFNKNYLIVKKKPCAERQGVMVYSYKACTVMESFDMINGHLTHTVAFRKKDCAKYLSPEEILGNVKKRVDEFVGDAPQFDDLTMLCLEIRE